MAYGVIKILAPSTHIDIPLSGTGGGASYPSIKVLNPNDGVVYIARNRDCTSVQYGAWDWKVPSQSYAILPGPFSSVGVFYLDQSGAGRQGEITVYASQQKTDDPFFVAIGRALTALQTTLDVTEGTIPGNPGAGTARLWVDTDHVLHLLDATGVDRLDINSATALGGVLTGLLPNPGLAAGVAVANIAAGTLPGTALVENSIDGADIVNNSIGNNQLVGGTALTNIGVGGMQGSTYLLNADLTEAKMVAGTLTSQSLAAHAASQASGVTQNSGGSTTSATFVDMPSLTLTFTTLATLPTLVWLSSVLQCNTAGAIVGLGINVDGTDYPVASLVLASANTNYPMGGCMVLSLGAGSHTVKARMRTNAGTLLMDGAYASTLLAAEFRR